jgi:hypothetical protein
MFLFATSDWIGLGFLVLLVLLAVLAVWGLSKPYKVSAEEFEKRAREQPSMLSAGFIGLQKILQPSVAKAVEAQQDLKQGRYDGEQGVDEPPEAGDRSEDHEGKQ